MLPREFGALRLPDAIAGDAAQWHRQLAKLRQDQADALYVLAQRWPKADSRGWDIASCWTPCVPIPITKRPAACWAMSSTRTSGTRRTRLQCSAAAWSGRAKFGWLEKKNVARYERGERLLGSTWIDAANDAALHADITTGWDIETEHYRIRTNDSIEAAVALGAKLENLNCGWRQIFIGYYATAGDVTVAAGRQADHRETAAADGSRLLPRQAAVSSGALKTDISMGLYVPENRTAYFYAGSEDSQRTMYHEATHQLFQQIASRWPTERGPRPIAG